MKHDDKKNIANLYKKAGKTKLFLKWLTVIKKVKRIQTRREK
jgi:hypothetical protein